MDSQLLNNILVILQITSILGGIGALIWRVENKVAILGSRFDKIEVKLEGLEAVTISIAKQEVRMDNIDSRMQELSNRITVNRRRKSPT